MFKIPLNSSLESQFLHILQMSLSFTLERVFGKNRWCVLVLLAPVESESGFITVICYFESVWSGPNALISVLDSESDVILGLKLILKLIWS